MTFSFKLTAVHMNDGSTVGVLPAGVTALVGPNNSGKSQLLREIRSRLSTNDPSVITSGLEISREGDQDDLLVWLDKSAIRRYIGGADQFFLENDAIGVQRAFQWFRSGPPIPGAMANFLIRLLDAESRLALSSSVESFDAISQPPRNALQRMYLDPASEALLSDAFREAFGVGIVVNRLGGSRISLHVGDSINAALSDPVEYLNQIALRPHVQGQGDGVRSYIGILLAALASPWPVLLIDEPEAFLHPPQARALGRQLAAIAAVGRQIIVATHSADVIRGLLDGPTGSVSLNRLTREKDVNHVASLPAGRVRELWNDPLLRFSSIIDGLFHTTVVLCESDADCRYYEAVLSSLVQAGELAPKDWLFVHCGGKHRMPSVVSALKTAGVPVRVIADIDILREAEPLGALMTMLSIDEGELEVHLNSVRSAVLGQSPQNPVGYVRQQLDAIFDEHPGPTMTPEIQSLVREATRSADGWSMVKRAGINSLPQGQATTACQVVLARLSRAGLHVVPVGELERWDATVPGHGPNWATAALENGSHEVVGSPVWQFVKDIASDGDSASAPPHT